MLCLVCLLTAVGLPVTAAPDVCTAPALSYKYMDDHKVAVIIEKVPEETVTYTIVGGGTQNTYGTAREILMLNLPKDSGLYITAYATCLGKTDSAAVSLYIEGYGQPTADSLRIVNPYWGAHFFTDVPADAWYSTDLTRLMKSGAIQGVTKTTFLPDASLTVGQYIKILTVTMYNEEMIDAFYGGSGPWYQPYMDFAADVLVQDGFLTANEADRPITRYEMAELLRRCFALGASPHKYQAVLSAADSSDIGDFSSVPEKYREAVLVAYASGMLMGVDDKGTFDGNSFLTRSQACATVVRLFEQF